MFFNSFILVFNKWSICCICVSFFDLLYSSSEIWFVNSLWFVLICSIFCFNTGIWFSSMSILILFCSISSLIFSSNFLLCSNSLVKDPISCSNLSFSIFKFFSWFNNTSLMSLVDWFSKSKFVFWEVRSFNCWSKLLLLFSNLSMILFNPVILYDISLNSLCNFSNSNFSSSILFSCFFFCISKLSFFVFKLSIFNW